MPQNELLPCCAPDSLTNNEYALFSPSSHFLSIYGKFGYLQLYLLSNGVAHVRQLETSQTINHHAG